MESFLRKNNLWDAIGEKLRTHDVVTIDMLDRLSDEELKEIGLSVGNRRLLEDALRKRREDADGYSTMDDFRPMARSIARGGGLYSPLGTFPRGDPAHAMQAIFGDATSFIQNVHASRGARGGFTLGHGPGRGMGRARGVPVPHNAQVEDVVDDEDSMDVTPPSPRLAPPRHGTPQQRRIWLVADMYESDAARQHARLVLSRVATLPTREVTVEYYILAKGPREMVTREAIHDLPITPIASADFFGKVNEFITAASDASPDMPRIFILSSRRTHHAGDQVAATDCHATIISRFMMSRLPQIACTPPWSLIADR